MDGFLKLCPENKTIRRLEDFQTFTVPDLKRVLHGYQEKSLGSKADLIMKVYAFFCCLKSVSQSQPSSLSLMFSMLFLHLMVLVLDQVEYSPSEIHIYDLDVKYCDAIALFTFLLLQRM